MPLKTDTKEQKRPLVLEKLRPLSFAVMGGRAIAMILPNDRRVDCIIVRTGSHLVEDGVQAAIPLEPSEADELARWVGRALNHYLAFEHLAYAIEPKGKDDE